jgi:hypothetical protein
MSFRIYEGEFDTPILDIEIEGRSISFAIIDFPEDMREWLGKVLESQIVDLVEHVKKNTLREHQAAMRELLGMKGH